MFFHMCGLSCSVTVSDIWVLPDVPNCNRGGSLWCFDNNNATCTKEALWASYQIRKIAGCAYAGNAGNVFPATDFKGNRQLAIPACITAREWRTCRDACRDQRWWGKRSRHLRRMRNPQYCVSGKRPMCCCYSRKWLSINCMHIQWFRWV